MREIKNGLNNIVTFIKTIEFKVLGDSYSIDMPIAAMSRLKPAIGLLPNNVPAAMLTPPIFTHFANFFTNFE